MKYHTLLLLFLVVLPCCKNEDKKSVAIKEDHKIEEIKTYLAERAAKDSLHGVVLLGKNDNVLLHKAFGYVDLDSTQKHTLESKIGLASLGKMFTAISIMQLQSDRIIGLNDLASKYLDAIENKSIRDSVRIRHLLSHTSGMGNYWAELRAGDRNKTADLEYIYSLVKDDTLVKPVGKTFGYSNSGYILLGKIIEEVTGLTYNDYVLKNIVEKCEMTDTEIGAPAGGGQSTAADLWKFAQALKEGKLLANSTFETMVQKQSDVAYGYGFMINTRNGTKSFGHNGGWWNGEKLGIAAYFFIIDNGYTVVVLTNRNPDVGGVGDQLHEILTKKEPDDDTNSQS
ncbi:serine hydrolase domain-containing protein [Flavobacteriaceae bacterium GF1]